MSPLFGIITCLFLSGFIILYNRLVRNKMHVAEAWSGIDVQLKRRYDLIPNIVAAVKGYMQHEGTLLENITALRNQAMGLNTIKEKTLGENNLAQAVKTLFAVAEAYPNLKADQHFLDLQKTLTAVEDDLQLARRYYNGTVRDYNILVQSFPSNILAGLFRFNPQEFFEIESALERQTPVVKVTT